MASTTKRSVALPFTFANHFVSSFIIFFFTSMKAIDSSGNWNWISFTMADKAIKSLLTRVSLVESSPRYTSQQIHSQSLCVFVCLFHFSLDDENHHDICWSEYMLAVFYIALNRKKIFKFRPKCERQHNTFSKIIRIFKNDFIRAKLNLFWLFIDEICRRRLCAECVHFMMDCLFYLLILIRSVKLISAMPKSTHSIHTRVSTTVIDNTKVRINKNSYSDFQRPEALHVDRW